MNNTITHTKNKREYLNLKEGKLRKCDKNGRVNEASNLRSKVAVRGGGG